MLHPYAERDWSVSAGTLTWSCWTTAAHIAHDLLAYAGQVAASPTDSYLPYDLRVSPDAIPAQVLTVVRACAVGAAPTDARPCGSAREGAPARARELLAALWDEIGPTGDALHRCTLAHYLADLQDTTEAELAWDERALAAVSDLTDERAQRYLSSLQVQALLPSLYLTLADCHRRLGNVGPARGTPPRPPGSAAGRPVPREHPRRCPGLRRGRSDRRW